MLFQGLVSLSVLVLRCERSVVETEGCFLGVMFVLLVCLRLRLADSLFLERDYIQWMEP